ncbi:MAG: metallophosphoesterase [Planctomycetota bacterium]
MNLAVTLLVALCASAPAAAQAGIVTDRPQHAPLRLPADESAFTFAVFGDRTGGPAEGVRVLEQAVRDVNLVGPDLVMTVGDLVQGYNQTPEWLVQMAEFKSIMDDLACPWFPVAGNHDIYWRGARKPAGEHEANYERHFGPLWYAFEHKDAWFIVLFTDEGDPATGTKSFNDPDAQRMSPAQFEWLATTLERAAMARHVFLFVHHPRWIEARYGEDWRRVHALLVETGNVRAVFGGHIHHMRADPADGIDYFALATVGGHQDGIAPKGGFVDQYHLVTVRDERIDVAAYPVGAALDPRQLTGELVEELRLLHRKLTPTWGPALGVGPGGAPGARRRS